MQAAAGAGEVRQRGGVDRIAERLQRPLDLRGVAVEGDGVDDVVGGGVGRGDGRRGGVVRGRGGGAGRSALIDAAERLRAGHDGAVARAAAGDGDSDLVDAGGRIRQSPKLGAHVGAVVDAPEESHGLGRPAGFRAVNDAARIRGAAGVVDVDADDEVAVRGGRRGVVPRAGERRGARGERRAGHGVEEDLRRRRQQRHRHLGPRLRDAGRGPRHRRVHEAGLAASRGRRIRRGVGDVVRIRLVRAGREGDVVVVGDGVDDVVEAAVRNGDRGREGCAGSGDDGAGRGQKDIGERLRAGDDDDVLRARVRDADLDRMGACGRVRQAPQLGALVGAVRGRAEEGHRLRGTARLRAVRDAADRGTAAVEVERDADDEARFLRQAGRVIPRDHDRVRRRGGGDRHVRSSVEDDLGRGRRRARECNDDGRDK